MLTVIKAEPYKANYTTLLNNTLRNTDLSATAYRLHLYLLTCGRGFFPTQRIMAQKLRVSNRTIERAVNELQTKGYLNIRKRKTESTYTTEWYVSELPNLPRKNRGRVPDINVTDKNVPSKMA